MVKRVCVFLSIVLVTLPALAQEGTQSRLDEINQQIDADNVRIDEIRARKVLLENELKKIQSEMRGITDKQALLNKELAGIEGKRKKLEEEVRELDLKIQSTETLSRSRLRAVYMNQGGTLLEHLLAAGASEDFARNALYVKRIRAFDISLVANLGELKKRGAADREELERSMHARRGVVEKLEGQKSALKARATEKEKVVASLGAEKAALVSALASLKAQALRLETVVRSLTGGGDEEASLSKGDTTRSIEPLRLTDTPPFSGPGLSSGGRYSTPVTGAVARRYGKYYAPELKETLQSKGIEFRAKPGSSVGAIEAGRIIFSGRMPKLGNVVIIDHGKRDYSLYGKIDGVTVAVGDEIGKGSAVGVAGEDSSSGSNVYFEIRRGGAPVNPQQFVTLR